MSKREKERRQKIRENVRVYGHTAYAMYAIGNFEMGDAYRRLAANENRKLTKLEDYNTYYWNKVYPNLYADAVELPV